MHVRSKPVRNVIVSAEVSRSRASRLNAGRSVHYETANTYVFIAPGEEEVFLSREEVLQCLLNELQSWEKDGKRLSDDLAVFESLEEAAEFLLDSACELELGGGKGALQWFEERGPFHIPPSDPPRMDEQGPFHILPSDPPCMDERGPFHILPSDPPCMVPWASVDAALNPLIPCPHALGASATAGSADGGSSEELKRPPPLVCTIGPGEMLFLYVMTVRRMCEGVEFERLVREERLVCEGSEGGESDRDVS
ncbi:unnamed protein product [Closterium sp. NIES-64]|nr:unnamed protein product [Closterium sp. NIES-64]